MVEKTFIKTSENVGYYHSVRYSSIQRLNKDRKMHGAKRVVTFCLLIVILPATLIIIPLYLRHSVFSDVTYSVAESDIIEIRDGISSIFCQQHSLKMSTNFNAFQLQSKPETSPTRKHIRLKKSMTLPDDTLEYWGFYLLKGAIVELKVCSRYNGSTILVVKGDKILETCGLLEHNKNKIGAHFAQGHEKVQVTFETVAEIVLSEETHKNDPITSHNYLYNNVAKSQSQVVETEDDENYGGEDFTDEKDQIISDMAGITSHRAVEMAPRNVLNTKTDSAISDLKTENVSNNYLRKFHETDTYKNAINGSAEILNKRGFKKLRHRRHQDRNDKTRALKHSKEHARKRQQVYEQLYGHKKRQKRDQVYDAKISHGGNAFNFTDNDSESISSFENSLLSCYDGQILLAQGFDPSSLCLNVSFLESHMVSRRMVSRHEVVDDGYYYYIFYSDNDNVRNDIHAVFDIYKPTFQYSNITDSKACVNSPNCTFPINFLSDEIVVVEVPTRDGIEHDEDDITYLVSTCHPRMAVYIIFPISVLLLILSCAFL